VLDRGTADVLGSRIAAVDYDAAVERIMAAARDRRPLAVSALAVHGLMTGVLDPVHRYRLNAFDLLVPDGQPVRWALRWLHGLSLPDRVYGPELMRRLCERAAREGTPIFLFGGTADQLAAFAVGILRCTLPACVRRSSGRYRQTSRMPPRQPSRQAAPL
jgi:hypothetical protein